MEILVTSEQMGHWSGTNLGKGRSIGLVPTMGALHEGHLSLVQRAAADNDAVVVSVFVNPIQFNNSQDLERYPRTFDADREMLAAAGVDVMFHPSVSEVYPTSTVSTYDLDGLDAHMEGPNRPGHFNGVIQVVTRLFDIVRPSKAYFGEKDFQQLAIIRHMSAKLGYAMPIIGCPTMRETDGLAMSSRNRLLTEEWRQRSTVLFEVLEEAMEQLRHQSPERVRQHALQRIEEAGLRAEYFELVRPDTLRPVDGQWTGPVQACVAAWAGEVRLIDNLRVK